MSIDTGFPKSIPEMTPLQIQVSDEWMKYWHENAPSKYGINERFNNDFPIKSLKHRRKNNDRERVLEIGAGIGEHISREDLSGCDYYALDLRENMINELQSRYPEVHGIVGNIEKGTTFENEYFDRIIAIMVLEHLPDLPSALREVHRLLKKDGVFSVVIPCEQGLLHRFARSISGARLFKKEFGHTGVDYYWLIEKTEHINLPAEIMEECGRLFDIMNKVFFPSVLPVINLNLAIGINYIHKEA